MVKKTINFSDTKILDDFDKLIIKKHGTIRGYRTETLELLMTDYATGNYEQRKKDIDKIKGNYESIQGNYKALLEEKEDLEENNKKLLHDIHVLVKKNEVLQKELETLKLKNENVNKLLVEKDIRIDDKNIELDKKNEEIKRLNEHITKRNNDYKHLESVRNKELGYMQELNNNIERYSYVIGNIESMNLFDRIFKRYPKEIKELPVKQKEVKE